MPSLRLIAATLAVGTVLSASSQNPFKTEADNFIANMPSGLQTSQTEAVRAAISGNTKPLQSVRASRNAQPAPLPEGVTTRDTAPGMRLFIRSDAEADTPLLVYFHGGGWTFGSINSCTRYCAAMADAGVAVLAVDYRLAPEHPYPAALDDCVEAVRMACDSVSAWGCGSVSAGGDSSGGNLAIATAMRLSAGTLRSLVLFYPVTRAYDDGSPSYGMYGSGYGLDSALMDAFNDAYTCGGADCKNPLISPADAPDSMLSPLPPVMIVGATRDILYDQGVAFARRLETLGVPVSHHAMEDAVHLFITVPGQPSAFGAAVEASANFIKEHGFCHLPQND